MGYPWRAARLLGLHVEAVMPDSSGYLGAHSDGGVQVRPIGYDRRLKPQELFVSLPATAEQEDGFYSFLHVQLGSPYDMSIIKGFASGMLFGQRDWRKPGSWICSELQAAAMMPVGLIKSIASKPSYVTPRDVLMGCGFLASLGEPGPAFPQDMPPPASPVMIGMPPLPSAAA